MPDSLEALAPDQVYAVLGTRPEGLSALENQARLHQFGYNLLREARGKPLLLKLLANFIHLIALLLWIGGLVAIVAQMPQLGVAICPVNHTNGAFCFWQEFKAKRATEALKQLLPCYARVLRGGGANPSCVVARRRGAGGGVQRPCGGAGGRVMPW